MRRSNSVIPHLEATSEVELKRPGQYSEGRHAVDIFRVKPWDESYGLAGGADFAARGCASCSEYSARSAPVIVMARDYGIPSGPGDNLPRILMQVPAATCQWRADARMDPKINTGGKRGLREFLNNGPPGRIRTADLVINRRVPPGN